jgi:DNA invertase Pin-like site-specific DNA recombinase
MGREGDSFQSPEQQREKIAGWAKLRGVEITDWFEDIDKSGNVLSRPGLDALLERVGTGQLEGIAVAKLDRLSRAGVADALRLVESIHDAGGQVAAVDLGLDPTTPFGEFGMTMMLGLARMERRRLIEGWDISKANALDRGVHIGPTPFGYRRQVDDAGKAIKGQPLIPDEHAAPIVRETFRLSAEQGLSAASSYLKRAAPDRASEANHIARMLARRVYLGEVAQGDHVQQAAHEPLVDRIVWERAQTHVMPHRKSAEPFPLSGLATCAQCGNALVGSRAGRDATRNYRCQATLTTWPGTRCTAGTNVTAHLLEQQVTDAVRERLASFPTLRKIYSSGSGDIEDARTAVEVAERELSTFATNAHARARLGDTLWQQSLDARADAVEEAQAAYREHVQHAGVEDGEWLDFPLSVLFDLTEPQDRRMFFDAVIKRCSVRKGRTPLASRLELTLREAPDKDRLEITTAPDAFLALQHAQDALDRGELRWQPLESPEPAVAS